MTGKRFDIVVFNYKKIGLFLDNFNKISNFNNDRDRITIITTSPSEEEAKLVKKFGDQLGTEVRYLTRKNEGIDQLGRIEYFLGKIGEEDRIPYQYIFQMQEHYFDTTSAHSTWRGAGAEWDGKPKGDIVPEGITFDLDGIENIFLENNVSAAFCDRDDPCFFEVDSVGYIAPNGGNFILKSALLNKPVIRSKIKYLKKTFENTYEWAIFAEFFWGEIFFTPGSASYDLKRKRIFDHYNNDDFHVFHIDYKILRNRYTSFFHKILVAPFSKFKLGVRKFLRPLKNYFKHK